MKPIKITSAQRLDKFLQEKFPQYSRAFIKEQIKLGNFLVYPEQSRGVARKVKSSYILREPDQVGFAPGFTLPDAAQILPNLDIKLNIIYEDENVIVINKPAGLSVHPRQDKNGLPLLQEINTTLVSGLLAYYPAIANVGETIYPLPCKGEGGGGVNIRPGIVHRLDKDTSGVMIIAKNQTSFDWLKKQFKERQTTKKYLALVHGSLKNKEGEIKTLLARAKNDPTKQKVVFSEFPLHSDEGRAGWGVEKDTNTTPSQSPPQPRGRGKIREAITRYKVIKEFKDYSLLEASPKTGRLHQIRVHLAYLGHQVAGDAKYGPAKLALSRAQRGGEKRLSGLTRQFLHAKELEIALPDGQKKTFLAPLPADLQAVLDALAGK